MVSKNIVNISIDKAKKIPRKVALLKIKKKATENRPVFAITQTSSNAPNCSQTLAINGEPK